MPSHPLEEARRVLGRRGLIARRIDVLSPAGSGRKRGRATLRADLTEGATIKIRLLESAREAARLAAIRRLAAPPFAPVIAHERSVLLEAWIAGRDLTAREAEERAADLGAILGGLHAVAVDHAPPAVPTGPHRARADSHLQALADAGVLAASAAATLSADLRQTDPGSARAVIVHLDYCPENLVVDASGALHVIDNEWMRLGPAGLDIGRTYARWPAAADAWDRFLEGYRRTAGGDDAPLRFWMIVMAAASAAIRLPQPARDPMVAAGRLRELAAASVA